MNLLFLRRIIEEDSSNLSHRQYFRVVIFIRLFITSLICIVSIQIFAAQKVAILDLENWDGETISLHQDWEFYWDQYLIFDENGQAILKDPIFIPSNLDWNKLHDTLFWQPFGKGVYHLKVINCKFQTLAIRTEMYLGTSFRLFVNDSLIGSLGNTGYDGHFKPEIDKKILRIPSHQGTFDIFLECANYVHGKSGPLSQLSLGQADIVERNSLMKLIFEIGAVAFTLAIAFRSLMTYLFDRSKIAHLSLFLMLALSSLRCVLIGEVPAKIIWPEIPFFLHDILRTFGFIMGLSVAFRFAKNIAPKGVNTAYYKIFEYSLLVAAIGVCITPGWLHPWFSIVAQIIIPIGIIYISIQWARQAKNDKSIYLLLTGTLIFSVVFIHDALAARQLIPFGILQHYGVLLFAISYSAYLDLYFIKRSEKLSSISADIQEMGVISKNQKVRDIQVITDLKEIKRKISDGQLQRKLQQVINKLNNQGFYTEKQVTAMENFIEVGDNFGMVLDKKFPNLTKGERELCYLIKANLTTKEIAEVRNITVDSAKLARKRLRKKLNLNPETDLRDFISSLH